MIESPNVPQSNRDLSEPTSHEAVRPPTSNTRNSMAVLYFVCGFVMILAMCINYLVQDAAEFVALLPFMVFMLDLTMLLFAISGMLFAAEAENARLEVAMERTTLILFGGGIGSLVVLAMIQISG